MALDTRNRRASSVGMARPWLVQPPLPDGTVGTSDRQQTAYHYIGILATAFVVPDLITYIMTVTEVSQPVMEIL